MIFKEIGIGSTDAATSRKYQRGLAASKRGPSAPKGRRHVAGGVNPRKEFVSQEEPRRGDIENREQWTMSPLQGSRRFDGTSPGAAPLATRLGPSGARASRVLLVYRTILCTLLITSATFAQNPTPAPKQPSH